MESLLAVLAPYIGTNFYNALMSSISIGKSIYDIGNTIYNYTRSDFNNNVKKKMEDKLNHVSHLQAHKRKAYLEKMRPVENLDKFNNNFDGNITNVHRVINHLQNEKRKSLNNIEHKNNDDFNYQQYQIMKNHINNDNNNNDAKSIDVVNNNNESVIKKSPLMELRNKMFPMNPPIKKYNDLIQPPQPKPSKIPILRERIRNRPTFDDTRLYAYNLPNTYRQLRSGPRPI